jgi:hypothetical protein
MRYVNASRNTPRLLQSSPKNTILSDLGRTINFRLRLCRPCVCWSAMLTRSNKSIQLRFLVEEIPSTTSPNMSTLHRSAISRRQLLWSTFSFNFNVVLIPLDHRRRIVDLLDLLMNQLVIARCRHRDLLKQFNNFPTLRGMTTNAPLHWYSITWPSWAPAQVAGSPCAPAAIKSP